MATKHLVSVLAIIGALCGSVSAFDFTPPPKAGLYDFSPPEKAVRKQPARKVHPVIRADGTPVPDPVEYSYSLPILTSGEVCADGSCQTFNYVPVASTAAAYVMESYQSMEMSHSSQMSSNRASGPIRGLLGRLFGRSKARGSSRGSRRCRCN